MHNKKRMRSDKKLVSKNVRVRINELVIKYLLVTKNFWVHKIVRFYKIVLLTKNGTIN